MNAKVHAIVATAVCGCALAVLCCVTAPRVQAASVQGQGVTAAQPSDTRYVSDPDWPREYVTSAGTRLTMYQPQVASWDERQRLVAYVAVAYAAQGEEPLFGTLRVEADTSVALASRLVNFATFAMTEAHFGSASPETTRRIVRDIERTVPELERVISLDRVLAGLDASQILPRNVQGVKADPPTIFVSTTPAILVNFDGPPIWSSINGNELKFAVNTNWDIFEYTTTKDFFLRFNDTWLKAGAFTGPWLPAGTLPGAFARLPADDNWKDVLMALPGRPFAARDAPAVFVSTTPAELILLQGRPAYFPVSGNSRLFWVSNTDSDVFRLGLSGPVYYLVAGRWFSSSDFSGPWTFATPTLPPDFKAIPANHSRARVLTAVPGTREAAEAVVLAQIPQTAKVSRTALAAPAVVYQGDPQFQPIEGTTVMRAVNTGMDVVKVDRFYYLCYQGIWFVSERPLGPWTLATTVPSQIYAIPASSPLHHVTYVKVVEYDRDWVVFAASSGYAGVMVSWGCAVWGTGWYHAPYVWYGGPYPVYYPLAPTYGYSARYNSATGGYARGGAAYGPYGGAGAAARYNPTTGTYSRGAVAWGPYGANGAAQAYNPRTGTYAQTRQGGGVYGSWGSTYVQRGDDWAQTAHVTDRMTGTTGRVTRTSDGTVVSGRGVSGSGFVASGDEGVYAGRDGNVYRHADDGGWQKYENGAWGTTQTPDGVTSAPERSAPPEGSTLAQLERDRSARLDGNERARERSGERSGEARPTTGSGRPSGGRGGRR